MFVKITLEERHFLDAEKKNPHCCPIAKALLEQISCRYVVVGYSEDVVSVRKNDGSWFRIFPIDPQKFRKTINFFDAPYMVNDNQKLIGTTLQFKKEGV